MTLLVIAAMLITPLSAIASSDTAPAGPQALRGRALIDTITPLQFPNQIAPRDDSVIAQAAGVPVGATAAEAKAMTDSWLKQFNAKNEKSGPNPIAYNQRMQELAQADAMGKSPKAAGLGEIGVAEMLMVAFEFAGTDELPVCDDDGNPMGTVTASGPLHNEIPDPAGTGDNNTLWTSDFNIDWYDSLIFGDGVGVVRTDLNDGAGVDLTGVSGTNWYAEQSEGLYDLQGEFFPQWVQLDHSEGFYGWEGGDPNPYGAGVSCSLPSGNTSAFVGDTIAAVNADDPNFDWATYDTDNNGIVDHFMVVHAGVGDEAGGGEQGTMAIWSHSFVATCDNDGNGTLELGCLAYDGGTADPSDDIYVVNYTVVPEDADIGVVVHEYGHDIGLPDYYDTSGASNNSTAHWIVMSGGSWNGPLGGAKPAAFNPWARWFFGWADPMVVNYDDPMQEVMIGQSDPTPAGTEDSVWVNLPDQELGVPNLAGDGGGLHAELGDLVFETVTKEFDLSGTTAPVFTFTTDFDIEEDWDYSYVRVSTDGGATWDIILNDEGLYATANPNGSPAYLGAGGLTGVYDGLLTFDLSAYAGSTILLEISYVTDTGFQAAGIWVDNFSLDDGATNLYYNDLDDPSDWTIDGWEEVPFSALIPHYYMLEWRNNEGSIASDGLDYNYQTLAHAGTGWMVDRVPMSTPGMVVWYRNNLYPNNNIYAGDREYDGPAYGPKGELLLVDARYDVIEWTGGIWDPVGGHSAPVISNRRAASDGAFTLDTTPAWNLHDYADVSLPVYDFGSMPAVPAFHDSMRSVPGWFLNTLGSVSRVDRASSVVIPAQDIYTTRIRGLEADESHLDYNGDLTDFWGYTVGGLPLGSGNPGDENVQYGFHAQVMDQAADGSYGTVKIWNSMYQFDGMVSQTPSTNPAVMGTYLDVNVNTTNTGGAVEDALFMVPVDPDTEYVMGSAYGGAYPLTAAYAAQLAAEKGLTDLADAAAGRNPDDVVAVAWSGEVPTGFNVDFGFATQITNAPATVQYTAAIFNGATLIGSVDGETVDVIDNSTYPVSRSRRFNVDRDSYINGTQPGMYYGSDQTMWVGFYDQMRPVVHTPINGIPTDSPVDQAWLYLYVTEGRKFGNWSQSVLENVTAHPATTEWMPYAVNWWMPWTMPGGDYGPGGVPNHLGSGKIGTWLRLDITAAVEDMLRSGENQGFLLNSSINQSGVHYGLATKEYWDPSKLGYIRVYFRTAS